MTCRFELEHKGEPYPRSCPTCGLAGSCQRGYKQVKLTVSEAQNQGRKYVILDPKGRPDKPYANNAIPASVLIELGKDEAQAVAAPGDNAQCGEEYLPIDCNVARRKNGVKTKLTCGLCMKPNGGSDISSADAARGCLHWHHELGFGFRPGRVVQPGDPEHEASGYAVPLRDPPPERAEVPESLKPFLVKRKLTRVQRARIMDAIETEWPHKVDQRTLDVLADDIERILNED